MFIFPEDGLYIVLINFRVGFTDFRCSKMLFKIKTYPVLITETNLGIWNNRGQKKCMGCTAHGAFDTTDAQTDGSAWKFYASLIVTMNAHAGRMTTGTRDLMKLNTVNDRIIKRLRNMVAIPDKNGYHGIVDRRGIIHVCG